jgi:hypothetical protein
VVSYKVDTRTFLLQNREREREGRGKREGPVDRVFVVTAIVRVQGLKSDK